MAFARVGAICLLAAAVLSSCSRSPLEGPPDAQLSYYEVSALAVAAAKVNGVSLENYPPPVVSFNHSTAKPTWRATFTATPPAAPGGNFYVLVDDVTKATTYFPGE